ncbi:sodium-coupled monocarboxylate transporter 1 [Leguminivora glycinivorella]|uniref:sodium-coupled monocarboxylate transporter 1 n=1 Tax=Leguminivora glycinivorella TaxID=1035111 RepID=UPI00200F9CCB|nr:sodium-coupled monocarboxylate transporter 1 [Leguminivora glycinivorella]
MATGWLAWECVVFGVFVCATSCAPLWRARGAGAGGSAKRAYIFAGGGVSTLTMVLSVARGTLGVRSFLGFPSELVYRGSAMWETLYGMILAFPLVCWVFVPVYYRLQTNSVYEYLQMRFHCAWVRRAAAATFLVRQLLNLAVTVFTPTVALHAVLALPHWASAAALTAVGIVFNLLGGLSAAIKADVIQTMTMILVSGAFIIQATIRAGGPQKVLADNIDGGRLQFFKFHWDPTIRVDTLSAIVGQLFMSLSIYGCQQTFVQRYCSMNSEARVRRTLLANVPAVGVLFSLSWVVGMALYAVYKYCDPLMSGRIAAPDEVLPFYVQDQFSFLPGMLGLFLGSLFNGALSFLVSNVNSLATVTWEDFVSAAPAFQGISDKQQLTVIKIIGVIYAIIIMCLSLCVGMVGGVIEGSMLVTSATSGALLGVFVLATLCPIANGKGALWGMIAAHFITTWMAAGRLLYVDTSVAMLPLSVDECPNGTMNVFHKPLPVGVNQTLMQLEHLLNVNTSRVYVPQESVITSALHRMYAVSYMWYAVIGTFTCVIIGCIIGAITSTEDDVFDERLLHPLVVKIYNKMPGKKRTYSNEKAKTPEKDSSEKTDVTLAEDLKETNSTKIPSPAVKKQEKEQPVFGTSSSKDAPTVDIKSAFLNPAKIAITAMKTQPKDTPAVAFATTSSRHFDAYDTNVKGSPLPVRTRL